MTATSSDDMCFIVNVRSITIDSRKDILFNIFKYLKIDISQEILQQWENDQQLPFSLYCEVECTIMLGNMPISTPIIIKSGQVIIQTHDLPRISILHQISRRQYIFPFEPKSNPITHQKEIFNIKFPIFYSELPLDSTLRFVFYACPFQAQKSKIGIIERKIFNDDSTLNSCPCIHTFLDDDLQTSQEIIDIKNNLQNYYNQMALNQITSYAPYSNYIKTIYETLHPNDSAEFIYSLFSNSEQPKLSDASKFVMIDLPELPNFKARLNFPPFYTDFSTSIFYFSKQLNKVLQTKQLECISNDSPLSQIPYEHASIIADSLLHNFDNCFSKPSLYFAYFQSFKLLTYNENWNIGQKLKKLDTVDIKIALEFFTDLYNYESVREYATRCIQDALKKDESREEIILFLPQIMQALKCDYTKDLKTILFQECKRDIGFASRFYWASCSDEETKSIGQEMLKLIDDQSKQVINNSISFMSEIEKIISSSDKSIIQNAIAQSDFFKKMRENPVLSPIDPSLEIVGIKDNYVKIFTSKTHPVCLTLLVRPFRDKNAQPEPKKYIFKAGDDMRQDQLIVQLFQIMNNLFCKKNNDLQIITYKVLAVSSEFGCMEFVDDTTSLFDIINPKERPAFRSETLNALNIPEKKGKSNIVRFLLRDNPNQEEFRKRLDTYTKSVAGYTLMTYVLNIGDRHDNNLLLMSDGHFLHIDFGFVFGDDKPGAPPVKISEKFLTPIDPDIDNAMNKLIIYIWPAFKVVRENARIILILIKLMVNSGIECFQDRNKTPIEKLTLIEQGLLLDLPDSAALNKLILIFHQSINSAPMKIYDAIHEIAMKINENK